MQRVEEVRAAAVILPHMKARVGFVREAAIKLQAVQRRHLYFKRKRDDADRRVKSAAAVKVQALLRGRSTRRLLREKAEEKERVRQNILKAMSRGGLTPPSR